jgi:hypothetical protein
LRTEVLLGELVQAALDQLPLQAETETDDHPARLAQVAAAQLASFAQRTTEAAAHLRQG